MSNSIHQRQLHLLTACPDTEHNEYLKFIELSAKSGITHLQLRQKNWSFSSLLSLGRELQAVLKPYSVPLIINDNLHLTLELNADGVHLGQKDGDPDAARAILGADKIIGLSIENNAQLAQANLLRSINYVAASAVFPSKSKNNIEYIWGLDGLTKFCQASCHPVIAIGGINLSNIAEVGATAISGVAVISAIHEADDPKQYIQKLNQQLNHGGNQHE
ncbi:MAG: thiamine phosphate synthase [Neisseriaceae bacterium]|nr:MAG: thiamine phosphate synthase [Neisseriaceae bacterium]